MATSKTEPTAPTRWLTTRQMAERVQLHEKTLLRLAREKLVPCWRVGRIIRFDPVAVAEALLQRPAA